MFREMLGREAARMGLVPPGEDALAGMEIHFRLLKEWNRRINLTAVRGDEVLVRRHFLESIQAVPLLDPEGPILDLGSGNGFPGVPMALLRPGLRLRAADSSGRKCEFLRELFRSLGWDPGDVVQRRLTRFRDFYGLGPFRHITSRGVRIPSVLLSGMLRALESGGSLLLFRGTGRLPEIRKAAERFADIRVHTLAGRDRSCVAEIRIKNVPRGTF